MREKNLIYLDYNPAYHWLVRIAAWTNFFACTIFIVQTGLLISARDIFGPASSGDWGLFLEQIAANSLHFGWIKFNFIALRTSYILLTTGYAVAMWQVNRSAAIAFLGFTAVSLPIIQISQVFQWALVPIAHSYSTASGTEQAAYHAVAEALHTMTEYGDTLVNVVLFNGLNISWLVLFRSPGSPHPPLHFWWLVVMILLPFTQLFDSPILALFGVSNAPVTAIFFILLGRLMLRFRPLAWQNGSD